jgi:agmatine deiminase
MLIKAHVDLKMVNFIIKDTNRSWMRDSGPLIVKDENGTREAVHFKFNGWGKYPNHRKDEGVHGTISDYLGIKRIPAIFNRRQVILEGGAIDINGQGTLITTRECLLDQEIQVRNPGLTQPDYEKIFRDYLGITNVIWLEKGIEGDDTHGHVDDICRFVNHNTVLIARESNKNDKNHHSLEQNHQILLDSNLENGGKLNVVSLPMPGRIDFEDLRLPASYANFIFTNGALLVPVFNDKNDYKALGIIKDLFPDRDVIGISAVDLVWGLGTLHCLSREIPA